MANGYNQYIGMRYVPIIDGTWSETKNYEPLVVVLYNGNSYISKTYVPAGTLPTNETYWMLAANYNAQVEQYRQEVRQYQGIVDAFSDDIDAAEANITTLFNKTETLTHSYTIAEMGAAGFNIGSLGGDEDTTYTTESYVISDQGSNIANLRRLYPNGIIRVFVVGAMSRYGNVSTAAATVAESGSIAAGTWALTVTITGNVHNTSSSSHTISGTVRFIIEFEEL